MSSPTLRIEDAADSNGIATAATELVDDVREVQRIELESSLSPLSPIEAEVVANARKVGLTPGAANDCNLDSNKDYLPDWTAQISKVHTPSVRETTDRYGRQYFLFDDGDITTSLNVIVFDSGSRKMVLIRNVILSLDELLSIVSCEFKCEATTKISAVEKLNEETNLGRLLSYGLVQPTYVECVFPTRTIKIIDVSISMFMTVLTHLTSIYVSQQKQ